MKKKGFTLIELLAVIVVLAIIALIATPIVMNVIKNASAGAVERSADNYVKAVDTLIATSKLDGTPLVDGEYTIGTDGKITKDGKSYEVELSGTKPVGGTIKIENGQVVKDSTTIGYGDYTVTYKDGVATAEEKSSDNSELARLCDLVDGTANTIGAKYTCNLGDGNRTFYVLEVGSDPITNSTLESNEIALILEDNYDATTHYFCDQAGDNPNDGDLCQADGLNAKLDEIAGVWTKLNRNQIGIPSADQIVVADGQNEGVYFSGDGTYLNNEWLYNSESGSSFWTSTPAPFYDNGWYVMPEEGWMPWLALGGKHCVRPIIVLEV